MSDLATVLVAWLAVYTYAVAALTVLVGAIGVPLPSAVVVLAAGAISTDSDVDMGVLFGVILAAAVTGDLTSYSLARWGRHLVAGKSGARVGLTPERIATAERRFERWGGLLVLVTRFVLTGLALPSNLAAGASAYPLLRFFGYVVVGEAIWTGGYLWLGWLFGPGWISLLDYLDDAATVLTAVAVAAILGFVLVRVLRSQPSHIRSK